MKFKLFASVCVAAGLAFGLAGCGDDNAPKSGDAKTLTVGASPVPHADILNLIAPQLQKEGISAELIDLRTIVPLDTETIIRSVKKTGKLLIVDEGHLSFGITGEIASRIMPDVFYDLDAPIQRMGTADVPLPFSPALEFPLIPDEKKIAAKIREMV